MLADDGRSSTGNTPGLNMHGVGMVAFVLPLLARLVLAGGASSSRCLQSEFACSNGRCISLNKYCDVLNDCGDNSDEPQYCTPCNRTFMGDIGKTYDLELHRPREDKLPFLCELTFVAGGGALGDIVQVTFDSFTLGRFVSFRQSGCPDGWLTIAEKGRPAVGGAWCGTSWGPTLYYSETEAVTLTVRLDRLSRDDTGYNFDFRILYKMLPRDSAIVRYGAKPTSPPLNATPALGEEFLPVPPSTSIPDIWLQPQNSYHLGNLIAGTYCSRIFNDCDRKTCMVQSPNFPGVYPRNLTCYYAVRQHEVPNGKQALISVRQPDGQLVAIRSELQAANPQQGPRGLRTWNACDEVHDFITVYDGFTTRDPALVKMCGGGAPVPPATSSGPELLVEFTSAPYGTFHYPPALKALHGFQLQVDVRFVDAESPTYTRHKKCEFVIRGPGKGVIETPRHSLPPNTTCVYHLMGKEENRTSSMQTPRRSSRPRYRIWLSVLKFHVPTPDTEECATQLSVWDGALDPPSAPCNDVYCEQPALRQFSPRPPPSNATLLAKYCRDQLPRTCDHAMLANGTRQPRPCSSRESFLSKGEAMALELRLTEATTLRPVSFRVLYEFVELQQEPPKEEDLSKKTKECFHRFTSITGRHRMTEPKDIFLYGRGGAHHLNCSYHWEGSPGERIRITIHTVRISNRSCLGGLEAGTGRFVCQSNATATLKLWNAPWQQLGTAVQVHCLCTNEGLPLHFTSASKEAHLTFIVNNMTAIDDFHTLHFEAEWEFIRAPACLLPHKLQGPSGEVNLVNPPENVEEANCLGHPWIIEPNIGRYLYVKVQGIAITERLVSTFVSNLSVAMSNSTESPPTVSPSPIPPTSPVQCLTKNRIIIHAGGSKRVIVCPQSSPDKKQHYVEVFSQGWVVSGTSTLISALSYSDHPLAPQRTLAVEFLAVTRGRYSFTWLELARRRAVLPPAGLLLHEEDCPYRCPLLDACINATLWCDGRAHCPSGEDEAAIHCSLILQLPVIYLSLAAAALLAATTACCLCTGRVILRKVKLRPRLLHLGPKEVIC